METHSTGLHLISLERPSEYRRYLIEPMFFTKESCSPQRFVFGSQRSVSFYPMCLCFDPKRLSLDPQTLSFSLKFLSLYPFLLSLFVSPFSSFGSLRSVFLSLFSLFLPKLHWLIKCASVGPMSCDYGIDCFYG